VLHVPAKHVPGTFDFVQDTKSRGIVHVPFFSSQRVHEGHLKGQVCDKTLQTKKGANKEYKIIFILV
jgi:hypothetical protein